MVEGGGFEPPKAEPADLQSAPFGHSGTPPASVSLPLCSIFNRAVNDHGQDRELVPTEGLEPPTY